MAYYDAEGNEVTGLLTQEDLDAKLEEERASLNSQFEEKNNETQQKIGELQAAQDAAQAAVDAAAATAGEGSGGGDKDVNLGTLRAKLEETTTALAAERDANRARFAAEESERVSNAILEVAGNNEEMAQKVRHHFTTTLSAVTATTPAEIKAKVENAFKLSADMNTSPGPLDIARAGGSRGAAPVINQGQARPMTAAAVEAGKMFGISDADRAKYGNDSRLAKK